MRPVPPVTTFFPREHGAYGQVAFPILTAVAVAGASVPGVLLSASVIAGFLAHEPAAVLLGHRGGRARRELWDGAIRWLGWCAALGATAGVAALYRMPAGLRWSLAVPLAPALVLAYMTIAGREKSSSGEVAAALAFAGVAVPVSLAGGARLENAVAIAVPFAILFICGTLAVRVVILKVRGGGNPQAVRVTRATAFTVAAGAIAALGAAGATDMLPRGVLAAALPGVLTATIVAASPPPPSRLRTLGWTLIAVSVLTAVVTIIVAS